MLFLGDGSMVALRPRQAGEDTRGIAKVVMGEKDRSPPGTS